MAITLAVKRISRLALAYIELKLFVKVGFCQLNMNGRILRYWPKPVFQNALKRTQNIVSIIPTTAEESDPVTFLRDDNALDVVQRYNAEELVSQKVRCRWHGEKSLIGGRPRAGILNKLHRSRETWRQT